MDALKKISCVEDDESIRMILKLALEDLGGFEVSLFASGQEALSGIEDAAPQLLILDMVMPGMDGIETLTKLRNCTSFSEVPVIFMTAKARPSEIAEYLKHGVLSVITKPFNPMTLSETVSDLWNSSAQGSQMGVHGALVNTT